MDLKFYELILSHTCDNINNAISSKLFEVETCSLRRKDRKFSIKTTIFFLIDFGVPDSLNLYIKKKKNSENILKCIMSSF